MCIASTVFLYIGGGRLAAVLRNPVFHEMLVEALGKYFCI